MKRPITLKRYYSRNVLNRIRISKNILYSLNSLIFDTLFHSSLHYFLDDENEDGLVDDKWNDEYRTVRDYLFGNQVSIIYNKRLVNEDIKRHYVFKKWFKYETSIKKIENQWRKSAYNPEYKLCRDIMRRNFAE